MVLGTANGVDVAAEIGANKDGAGGVGANGENGGNGVDALTLERFILGPKNFKVLLSLIPMIASRLPLGLSTVWCPPPNRGWPPG
jgi:hypothetical protein